MSIFWKIINFYFSNMIRYKFLNYFCDVAKMAIIDKKI
jgi:hypothetical protein